MSPVVTLWLDLNPHKPHFWRMGIQKSAVVPGLRSGHQGLDLHAQGKEHHGPAHLLLSTAGTG